MEIVLSRDEKEGYGFDAAMIWMAVCGRLLSEDGATWCGGFWCGPRPGLAEDVRGRRPFRMRQRPPARRIPDARQFFGEQRERAGANRDGIFKG